MRRKRLRLPFRPLSRRRVSRHTNPSFPESDQTSLKVYIWYRLYQSLQRQFCQKNNSPSLSHFNRKENDMIDGRLIKQLIHEIIATGEYTLEGIANYVRAPFEVIIDIVSGIQIYPSLRLSGRIIDLYLSVKRSYYQILIRKFLRCLKII